MTWNSLILNIFLIAPSPPLLHCSLSDAARESWESHDKSIVCSSPGYKLALSKSDHAIDFTLDNLDCLCENVIIQEQWTIDCNELFCFEEVCIGDTCFAWRN